MFVKMKLFCVCKNLFLVVASACLAYSMWHHQSATLAALYKIWSSHFPISSSTISSSLRRFILWTDRHFLTPPTVILLTFYNTFSIISIALLFVNHYFSTTAAVSLAMRSSSLVGTTHTGIVLSGVERRSSSPLTVLAASFSLIPRAESPSTMRPRTTKLF